MVDYSLETAEASDEKTISGMVRRIAVAEDIAKLRTEVEDEMFRKVAPKEQWKDILDTALVKYPNLIRYKRIFDRVLVSVKTSAIQLDSFWRDHMAYGSETSTDDLTKGIEKAGPKMSSELFYPIFLTYPDDEVVAARGALSLRFLVSDRDYKKLWATEEGWGGKELTTGGFASSHSGFPVIVLRREFPEHEVIKNVIHESEHGLNKVLETGKNTFLYTDRLPELGADQGVRQRMLDWEAKTHPFERSLKDELLAYFTVLEVVDYARPKLSEEVMLYMDKVIKMLKDPEGSYLRVYKKRFNMVEKEEQKYLEMVDTGAASLRALFALYREGGLGQKSARMVINVLQQFPLHHWKGVVGLIERRHGFELDE